MAYRYIAVLIASLLALTNGVVTVCPAGQKFVPAVTSGNVAPARCDNCADGKWNAANDNSQTCADHTVTVCAAGKKFVGSAAADSSCADCAEGTFNTANDNSAACAAHYKCVDSEVTTAGDATKDAVCKTLAKEGCEKCANGGEVTFTTEFYEDDDCKKKVANAINTGVFEEKGYTATYTIKHEADEKATVTSLSCNIGDWGRTGVAGLHQYKAKECTCAAFKAESERSEVAQGKAKVIYDTCTDGSAIGAHRIIVKCTEKAPGTLGAASTVTTNLYGFFLLAFYYYY